VEYLESLDKIDKLKTKINILADIDEKVFILLGAGASKSSGCSLFIDIANKVKEKYNLKADNNNHSIMKAFQDYLKNVNDEYERYAMLHSYFEGKELSLGYYCLAELIYKGYFNGKVMTLNIDILLEQSFQSLGLLYPKDFTVLIPEYHKEEKIKKSLEFKESRIPPHIKIIKLHGDLYAPIFMLRPGETFESLPYIKSFLEQSLNNHVIIIGYSMSFSDFDIAKCFEKNREKNIWYVNQDKPMDNSFAIMVTPKIKTKNRPK